MLRWGRNANVKVPKRFHSSGLHGQTYKEASAIECLVRCMAVHQRLSVKKMTSTTQRFMECSCVVTCHEPQQSCIALLAVCSGSYVLAGRLPVSDRYWQVAPANVLHWPSWWWSCAPKQYSAPSNMTSLALLHPAKSPCVARDVHLESALIPRILAVLE